MEIVEFIGARLDEEEADARAATPGPWTWDKTYLVGPTGSVLEDAEGYGGIVVTTEDMNHIARQDPAATVPRVTALRGLVAPHKADGYGIGGGWLPGEPPVVCDRCLAADDERETWPCDVVRGIAAIWAWHPDYQPEWVPAAVSS